MNVKVKSIDFVALPLFETINIMIEQAYVHMSYLQKTGLRSMRPI
jgi:hypothetical protein